MKVFGFIIVALLSMPAWAGSAVWVDVRSSGEFAGGHVDGAHNIPHTQIATDIAGLKLDKDAEILLYCRSGRRAGFALEQLQKLGYTNVKNIGGFDDAKDYLKK